MKSVADRLRRDTATRIGQLSAQERIALALSLGDDDLALYRRVSGKSRADALADLRERRVRGRTPSRSADPQR